MSDNASLIMSTDDQGDPHASDSDDSDIDIDVSDDPANDESSPNTPLTPPPQPPPHVPTLIEETLALLETSLKNVQRNVYSLLPLLPHNVTMRDFLGVPNQNHRKELLEQFSRIVDLASSTVRGFSLNPSVHDALNHTLASTASEPPHETHSSCVGVFPISFAWIYVVVSPFVAFGEEVLADESVKIHPLRYCKVGKMDKSPFTTANDQGRLLGDVLPSFGRPGTPRRELVRTYSLKIPCIAQLEVLEGKVRDLLAAFPKDETSYISNPPLEQGQINAALGDKNHMIKYEGKTEWRWIADETLVRLEAALLRPPLQTVRVPKVGFDTQLCSREHLLRIITSLSPKKVDRLCLNGGALSDFRVVFCQWCLRSRSGPSVSFPDALCKACEDEINRKDADNIELGPFRREMLLDSVEWEHRHQRTITGDWRYYGLSSTNTPSCACPDSAIAGKVSFRCPASQHACSFCGSATCTMWATSSRVSIVSVPDVTFEKSYVQWLVKPGPIVASSPKIIAKFLPEKHQGLKVWQDRIARRIVYEKLRSNAAFAWDLFQKKCLPVPAAPPVLAAEPQGVDSASATGAKKRSRIGTGNVLKNSLRRLKRRRRRERTHPDN